LTFGFPRPVAHCRLRPTVSTLADNAPIVKKSGLVLRPFAPRRLAVIVAAQPFQAADPPAGVDGGEVGPGVADGSGQGAEINQLAVQKRRIADRVISYRDLKVGSLFEHGAQQRFSAHDFTANSASRSAVCHGTPAMM